MSLATNVTNLATAVGTEIKATRGQIGDLPSLATTARTNLVLAINEVNGKVASAAGINDAATDTATTWSSSKTRGEIDAATAALIDDVTSATTTVYSSSQTDVQIAAAKSDILGGAGAAFDTLKELQDALSDDDTAITGIQDALGNRVRVDAAQTFDATMQAQARSNIGAVSAADFDSYKAEVGTWSDGGFVATFNAALA